MRLRAALPLLVALVVTGCGFLSRTQSRFFTIETAPGESVTGGAGAPVGIDVVELPPGLDRREVVVRQEEQRLEIRERDQWRASLEPMVLHTLAFNLASRLPEGAVVLPGQPIPTGAMRALDLNFEELAAGPGNAITVDVRWNLRQTGQPTVAGREEFTVDLASLESAEIAAGMTRALGVLADRLAAELAP